MAVWKLLTSAWVWDPSVVFGCIGLVLAYSFILRFRLSRASLYFFSGVLVLLLSLVSPLDTLGDRYLFSAHMLQHLLLVLVAPPLLLIGLPQSLVHQARRWSLLRRLERISRHPVIAWLIGTITLTIWHLPVLYSAALENERIHVLEHLTFLVSAVIFWWPVLTPMRSERLSPLKSALYLMPAASMTTLLGLFIAYNSQVIYPFYLHPVDSLGILPFLRDAWGLDPHSDQEIAGLMMWVPGSFVYLGVIMIEFVQWFDFSDRRSQA